MYWCLSLFIVICIFDVICDKPSEKKVCVAHCTGNVISKCTGICIPESAWSNHDDVHMMDNLELGIDCDTREGRRECQQTVIGNRTAGNPDSAAVVCALASEEFTQSYVTSNPTDHIHDYYITISVPIPKAAQYLFAFCILVVAIFGVIHFYRRIESQERKQEF